MEAIGPFAMEVAAKGTVVLLLAGGVALAAWKLSAAFRHLVWSGAMVMLLLLPVVVMVVPGWRVVPVWKTQNTKLETQSVEPVIQNSKIEMPIVVREGRNGVVATPTAGEKISAAPVVVAASPKRVDWGFWGVWAWVAGVAAMLLPLAGAAIYLRVMERRARVMGDGAWGRLLEQVRSAVGIRRRVVMLESARIQMPMTFGFLQPRIVLPVDTAGLSEQKRRMVLLHELTHVKRLDVVTHTVAGVARAMWWFHPLVWVAFRQMAIERERACDDRVIMTGADAAGYAETLLEIAAGLRSGTFLIGGIAMARQSTLETRVRAVLDHGCKRGRVRVVGMVLAGLAVLAVVPLGALRGADEVAKNLPGAVETAVGDSNWKAHPSVKLLGKTVVELVGISRDPANGPWWAADGSLVVPGVAMANQQSSEAEKNLQFLFHVAGLPKDAIRIFYQSNEENLYGTRVGELSPARTLKTGVIDNSYEIASVVPPAGTARTWIKIGVAQGDYQTMFRGAPGESGRNENGQFEIGNVTTPQGNPQPICAVTVTHAINLEGKDWSFVAEDTDGKSHMGMSQVFAVSGNTQSVYAMFIHLPVEKVKSICLVARPIEWAEFKDLPLEPRVMEGTAATWPVGDADEASVLERLKAQRAIAEAAAKANADVKASSFYYVMGAVEHAGVYTLPAGGKGLTPLQAVASAGINNQDQSLLMVRVVRESAGKQTEVLRKSVHDLLRSGNLDAVIQDGDVIYMWAPDPKLLEEINKVKEEQAAMEQEVENLRTNYSENNATVKTAEQNLARMNSHMDQLQQTLINKMGN